MPITPAAIDTFISEKVTRVTECNASDVAAEFPGARHWISGFALMTIFVDAYPPEARGLVLQFLRRTEMALMEYAQARNDLLEQVSGEGGRLSPYFRALSHFEVSVAQLYQAYYYSAKALGTRLFEKEDGSPLQRLNCLYNASKHERAVEDQPLWITNEGLECEQAALSFEEVEDLLRQCGRIATTATTNRPG